LLQETGILAPLPSERRSTTIKPSVVTFLGPRDRLEFSYSFNNTEYELEIYPDYYFNFLDLTWFHLLPNERTTVLAQVRGGQIDFEFELEPEDGRQRSIQGLVGVDHRFTETLTLALKGGGAYVDSEYPSTQVLFGTTEQTNTTYLLDGVLVWQLERFNFTAKANRDLYPSIFGELITRDRVSASLWYRFTEEFRGALYSAYNLSETEGLSNRGKRKEETYFIRPSLHYRFNEYVRLKLVYDYTHSLNKISDTTRDRNRVFFELILDWEGRY
jgi:hypothetical protein